MAAREVVFEGDPPWGFRMNGGADAGHPLRISRVNPGSKAEANGVREGDLISSINGQPTKCLTNSESHTLLRSVKENLRLGLNEDTSVSPRRKSREIKAASVETQGDQSSEPAAKENGKPSASKARRQRKARLRNRLKGLLGYKETQGRIINLNPFEKPENTNGSQADAPKNEVKDKELVENVIEAEKQVETVVMVQPKVQHAVVHYCSEEEGKKEEIVEEVPEDQNKAVEIIVCDADVQMVVDEHYDLDAEEEAQLEQYLTLLRSTTSELPYSDVVATVPTPSIQFYPRRYLEVISEEPSDPSDTDRPWEDTDKIRQINAIDGIPQDWFGSCDGIDTSWQGKSLEEVSDVPVVSDSHSDSDLLEETDTKRKIIKNIVSSYSSPKLISEPIRIDRVVKDSRRLSPNSDVVEIVYIDSSDSENVLNSTKGLSGDFPCSNDLNHLTTDFSKEERRSSFPLTKSEADSLPPIAELTCKKTSSDSVSSQSTEKTYYFSSIPTLKELCSHVVLKSPSGLSILKQLGVDYTDFDSYSGYVPDSEEFSVSSRTRVDTDSVGMSSNPEIYQVNEPNEELLILHQKFMERRSYFEPELRKPVSEPDKDEETEMAEFLALQKYHECRQRKMKSANRAPSMTSPVNEDPVGNSRLLDLIQNLEGKSSICPERNDRSLTEDTHMSMEPVDLLRTSIRPRSLPPSGEIFRQRMYEEYMNKLAELETRRHLKIVKLSEPLKGTSLPSDIHLQLESEFMDKVKERMSKLGLKEDSTNDSNQDSNLPKHVQELMQLSEECDIIGKQGLLVEVEQALKPEHKAFLALRGVWSPAQTPELERKNFDFSQIESKTEEKESEPLPPVWTPRSAGASPVLERKFKSVNFQSPPPKRKEYPAKKEAPELPKELPVEPRPTSSDATTLSPSLRLPASQNPTITLLQKAREGQIPKGAQYLDETTQQSSHQSDRIYAVKNEYSKVDDEGVKKVIELTPKKFTGIGPTTREGIPIGLRSEVNENNQQRWYKRMYDSLHKTEHDKDYVTVKYKTKRKDQYPYSYAGYASEPERLGYDSDVSLNKYATLDRRKIRNKENDFTTSTMPRNKYGPSVKHAVNVYKNQPGRIEDYEPGHSSIAEVEKRQWWDEVLNIFDGELNQPNSSSLHSKPYGYPLKDTGYDSDSTLVFKRREDMSSQSLSPAEQKMAYKVIQKGGEVPLHGLRRTVPERPKEESDIEYFPISPTLTRIRVHKTPTRPEEKLFYPVTVEEPVFGAFKRTAKSSVVPSPPRRQSSRNNSTLKLFTEPVKSPVKLGDKVKSSTPKKVETENIKKKKEILRKSPDLKAPAEVKKALKERPSPVKSTVSPKPQEKTAKTSVPSKTISTSSKIERKSPLSPVLKKPVPKTSPVPPKLSRPSSRTSTISTTSPIDQPKKPKTELKKKKEKKPEEKPTDVDRRKLLRKINTGKKTIKKKDKENVPVIKNMTETPEKVKSDQFFQHLLLKEQNPPGTVASAVQRSPSSVSERAKKFTDPQCYRSEPSLRNSNVYLSQKKPVSESRFRSLDRGCRALSPFYGTIDFFDKLDKFDKHNSVWECSTPTYESIKGRSSSEPPSASPGDDVLPSPSVSRSPSCRRIRRSSNKTVESVVGLRRKVRSKSLNEADRQSHMGSNSSLSTSRVTDHGDYQSYIFELLHSTRKSDRFKELHSFYSSLERMGELEKTASSTDLRPRLKNEEVIDFDRWKRLRAKEKAEIELSHLYQRLMDDQRKKDLFFLPKEATRWQGDIGLRSKEKSVEDLRLKFQKLSERADEMKSGDIKDVYKPLWRGNSVVNLAQSLTSITGSKRGRPVREKPEKTSTKPPFKPSREIGSRLWSSLSMEQVNALKSQLSEIYNTVSNLKHDRIKKLKQNIEEYEMNVAELRGQEKLHVRSNSLVSPDQLYSAQKRDARRIECMKADSISSIPGLKTQKPLTEPEKKKLSMSLSAEVKERIKKKKHGSLVIPRETLGAVAAIKGNKKSKLATSSDSPRTYSISDDSTDKKEEMLVLLPKDEAERRLDEWNKPTSSSSSSASTVIHLGSKDDFKSSHLKFTDKCQSSMDLREIKGNRLYTSQSYTDLKELFGERQATTYATLPLENAQKPFFSSTDSVCKSASSPDPMKYYRAYLSVVKAGDVRKLTEKFESCDDIYNLRREAHHPKLFQSDPDLTRDFLSRRSRESGRVVIKAQESGDVQWLRKKYEPRKLSPVPFRVEDRYMPHINVISKTVALQQKPQAPVRRPVPPSPGLVDRLRAHFEARSGLSLMGQMYTSTPEIPELRDIAPYLECDWIAHQNPRSPKPTRRSERRRPASASPIRQSILKHHDPFANQQFIPEIHRPVYRYQPQPELDSRHWYQKPWGNVRPTVTFKEPLGNPIPTPPRDHFSRHSRQESPHRYVESEVNIHYRSPIRSENKASWPEDELAEKQAEIMRRIYQEQRRTKYLNELHDMYSRRHTDNFIPSQKSPIPLNRYDDFPAEPQPPRPRDRTPEPKLVARALYNFVGQTSKELSFRRGDIIYVRRQIDKNWYEGEHNAMIGLFPFNYVEIIPYDGIRTLPKRVNEGQARAKFNFQAQTHLELSLVKGELVLLTRRVDENWFEGRIGNRKGIFPVSYVEVLVEPGERTMSPTGPISTKPIVAPASHSVMLNGAKDLGQQHYQPPRPALYSSSSLPPQSKFSDISLMSESLHIDTHTDPIPYRVLYNYKPQNDDELELKEGDVVYVMEKCDDGWYVGSLHRNGQFGTFPGNYVERITQ